MASLERYINQLAFIIFSCFWLLFYRFSLFFRNFSIVTTAKACLSNQLKITGDKHLITPSITFYNQDVFEITIILTFFVGFWLNVQKNCWYIIIAFSFTFNIHNLVHRINHVLYISCDGFETFWKKCESGNENDSKERL